MQHKLSQCIDFPHDKLNEHPDSAILASDCSAPLDDVEIATGQASFDNGDFHDELTTWVDSHRPLGIIEDPDDAFADFDYK